MKKLRLDLADVRVVSFEVPAVMTRGGTVQGHDDSEAVSYCGASCAMTCNGGPSKCDPFGETSIC